VQTEDMSVYERTNVHEVEEVRALLPHVAVALLAHNLHLEAVHNSHLPALVVASEQSDGSTPLQLLAEQQRQCLD